MAPGNWNYYPGARVDSNVPNYEYSFEELWRDWNWTERFPSWDELRHRFHYVDEKLNLSQDIEFRTRKSRRLQFDPGLDQWHIQTDQGTDYRARYFILCTGFRCKAYVPDIEGLDQFKGECHHTALGPRKAWDLLVSALASWHWSERGSDNSRSGKDALHLTVFQRTPILALPMRQTRLDEVTQREMKKDYPEHFRKRREDFGGFSISRPSISPPWKFPQKSAKQSMKTRGPWVISLLGWHFNDVLLNQEANRTAYDFWRDKTWTYR